MLGGAPAAQEEEDWAARRGEGEVGTEKDRDCGERKGDIELVPITGMTDIPDYTSLCSLLPPLSFLSIYLCLSSISLIRPLLNYALFVFALFSKPLGGALL